jgi:coenzyme F420 hydrogenase subunit beta
MSKKEIGFEIGKNIEFVVKNSLCTGCFTCEAVCPEDAVQINYDLRKGIYLPLIDKAACTECELCVMTCPGFELDINDRPANQNKLPSHPLVGPYLGIWRAHTGVDSLRKNAASGGMTSQVLAYMLSNNMIDGAIVTRMDPNAPMQTLSYIARTLEDLVPSQKSKYCPTPLNKILKTIIRSSSGYDRLALVGLPSHVHGFRLLQRIYPELQVRIPYVLSLFTSHVPSRKATEFLLFKEGIDPNDLALIEYRGDGIPGRLRFVFQDGRDKKVDHLHWTYWGHTFPFFFYPAREWLYFDKLSEWADFSMGDNWQKMEDTKGNSTVVTRSEFAENLIHQMIAENKIVATSMTADDLVYDQDLVKKKNIGIRLAVWRLLGRKVPIYKNALPIKWWDFPKTLIFAMKVMLCEHSVPYALMDKVIKLDYFLKTSTKKLARWIKLLKAGLSTLIPTYNDKSERKKKFKIVMVGGYGSQDIGDEAMPHADILNLKKLLNDDVEIIMLSHNPKYTALYHREKSISDIGAIGLDPNAGLLGKMMCLIASILFFIGVIAQKHNIRLKLWNGARGALDELASADLLFNVGGGNLNSIMTQELYKKCATYLAVWILGKPSIISGQTIGPFSRKFDKWYAKLALNRVHMITLRDKSISQNRLREIGVNKPVIMDAADDAMTIPALDECAANDILQRETGWDSEALTRPLVIAMNLKGSLKLFKGLDRKADLTKEINLVARIADRLIWSYKALVYFLPTDYNFSSDDRNLHRDILSRMEFADCGRCIEGEYSDTILKGLINLADVAIGARYHFGVFAVSECVPFLGMASGIYQQTKLKGLADLCGLSWCFIKEDMEFASFNDVWPQVTKFIENRDNIRNALRIIIPELKKRSLTAALESKKLLQDT